MASVNLATIENFNSTSSGYTYGCSAAQKVKKKLPLVVDYGATRPSGQTPIHCGEGRSK